MPRDDPVSIPEPQRPAEPEPDAASLHVSGLKALQAGEIDAAYNFARQAMRLDGDDPQIIFLMAMVLAERRRFPEAIQMLDEVAETTPAARLPALGNTADWLVRYGQWVEAEARYQQILEQMPDAVLAHRNLASLLLRQGRRWEARKHLDRLCHLGDIREDELRSMLVVLHPLVGDADEDSLEPIGPLGIARSEIAKADWQAALDRLQQLESPGPWESALLGRSYAVQGEQEALRSWLVDADESLNASPDAWFAKGVYAASVDNPTDAVRCFAETVLLDPTDADAYTKLAESMAVAGLTAEAETARQRADLISKTQRLGKEMAQSDERELESFLMLSDLLGQLRRPLEALGWQGVWLSYADATAAIPESETQHKLQELAQTRTRLLQQNQTKASAEFVLCGLDLATLPSRSEVDARLKSSASEPGE